MGELIFSVADAEVHWAPDDSVLLDGLAAASCSIPVWCGGQSTSGHALLDACPVGLVCPGHGRQAISSRPGGEDEPDWVPVPNVRLKWEMEDI